MVRNPLGIVCGEDSGAERLTLDAWLVYHRVRVSADRQGGNDERILRDYKIAQVETGREVV